MRLIAPHSAGPASVNKYLLPHEQQVITVRKHPAVLIGPIALTLAGLLVALILSATVLRALHPAMLIVWLAWIALLLRLIWKAIEHAENYFVVTSTRMLEVTGVVTRKVAMMPLGKVTDMSFRRDFMGRMLGYGEFILESAGQDQALTNVDHVPYPEQLYLEICGLIFKDEQIPCPVCKGQRVIVAANELGEPTTYRCSRCDGHGTVPLASLPPDIRPADSLPPVSADVNDD